MVKSSTALYQRLFSTLNIYKTCVNTGEVFIIPYSHLHSICSSLSLSFQNACTTGDLRPLHMVHTTVTLSYLTHRGDSCDSSSESTPSGVPMHNHNENTCSSGPCGHTCTMYMHVPYEHCICMYMYTMYMYIHVPNSFNQWGCQP